MPAQTQKVTLAGKYGNAAREAAAKHAKDPIRYGRANLPGGIKVGVARLTEIYLGTYEKDSNQVQLDGSSAAGELYLRLVGTVESPKTHLDNGSSVPIYGLQTSQVIPICARGANFRGRPLPDLGACVAEAINEVRAITGPDFDCSDLDRAIEVLTRMPVKPCFRFSTTLQKADPNKKSPKTGQPYEDRVWENWHGSQGLDQNSVNSNADGVVEQPTGNTSGGTSSAKASDSSAPLDETNSDLDSLLAAAEADDDNDVAVASRNRLKEMFLKTGKTAKDFDSCADWKVVVDSIRAVETSGDAEAGAGDDDFLPEVGQMYKYKHRDDKGNPLKDSRTKKEKKPVEVEILTVDADKKMVTCKDMEVGKTIVGGNKKAKPIPFDHLEGDE